MLNLEKLKQLEAKATKGPWRHSVAWSCIDDSDNNELLDVNKSADGELVTESRNQLPALIDWIERARPILEHVRDLGETWDDHGNLIIEKDDANEAAKLLGEVK